MSKKIEISEALEKDILYMCDDELNYQISESDCAEQYNTNILTKLHILNELGHTELAKEYAKDYTDYLFHFDSPYLDEMEYVEDILRDNRKFFEGLGIDYKDFEAEMIQEMIDKTPSPYHKKKPVEIDDNLKKWWEEELNSGYPENNGDWEQHSIAGFKEEDLPALIQACKELSEREYLCFSVGSFVKGKNDIYMLEYETIEDYDNEALDYLKDTLNLDEEHYVFYEVAGENNFWCEFDTDKCSLVSFNIRQYEEDDYNYYDTEMIVKDDLTGIEFDIGNGGCTYKDDITRLIRDANHIKKADNYIEMSEDTLQCIDWIEGKEPIPNKDEELDEYDK